MDVSIIFGIIRNRILNMAKQVSVLILIFMAFRFNGLSQNLVINPGAELQPAGTGWTIVSAGANACALGTAASSYTNWTMTPDSSPNYPSAHSGIKTFFAGCNTTVPAEPFELDQVIDVSADAAQIDEGKISYSFTGYIQTPFSPQADAGRFIVDYLNGTGLVLGDSYTSGYQSYAGGSGTEWHNYADNRKAMRGTRKIRIRLQSTIATSPAINAYFDDISLIKRILPNVLVSFSGMDNTNNVNLRWSISNQIDFSRFEIEKSVDSIHFIAVGKVDFEKLRTDYFFSVNYESGQPRGFFRLKIIDINNQFDYSPMIVLNTSSSQIFNISPNPASKDIVVTGLRETGNVFIMNMSGNKVLESQVNSNALTLNVSLLQKGNYWVYYSDGISVICKELYIE
jgi:hypothetical protein